MIPIALAIALHSVIATDRLQTAVFVKGVQTSPVLAPRAVLWERNPLIDGRPVRAERLFEWASEGVEAAPLTLPEKIALPVLAAMLAAEAWGVSQNNRLLERAGAPTYSVLAYQFHF